MIGVKLIGDWKKAQKILKTAPAAFDRALKKTIQAEAERVAAMIKKNIASNTPPPNAPSTVLQKGSSKTLINSGELRNSVQVTWSGKFAVSIGIPASALGGKGARLADIHENGRIIVQQMSEKQRKFLHSLFHGGGSKTGGTGIIVIHIPARPFIKPAFDAYKASGAPKFLDALEQNLEPWAKGS